MGLAGVASWLARGRGVACLTASVTGTARLEALSAVKRYTSSEAGDSRQDSLQVDGQTTDPSWQYPRPPPPEWGLPDLYNLDDLPVISLASKGQSGWEVLHVEEYSEDAQAEGGEVVNEPQDRVVWGLDFTNGVTPNNQCNALLSEEAKDTIYAYHKQDRVPAGQLAEMFRVRQQRIMAIVALKELEEQAAVRSEVKEDELAELMEGPEGFCPAEEVVGTGERHVKVLHNNLGYVDEAASTRAAEHEEAELVAEFSKALDFNLGKVGTGILRNSRKAVAPPRPAMGWSLVVRPLDDGSKPFIAQPDGSRRELDASEQLHLERKKPKPRKKLRLVSM